MQEKLENVYLLRVLPSVCFCLKELVVVIVILLSDKTKGNYFKALLAFSVPEHCANYDNRLQINTKLVLFLYLHIKLHIFRALIRPGPLSGSKWKH